jgi:hypothetical protein
MKTNRSSAFGRRGDLRCDRQKLFATALLVSVAFTTTIARAQDPLPSWNAGVANKTGKPVGINEHIGRRPIAAFGNSDGDQQMLEWTQAGSGARLMMLVHHDDAVREFAYGAESKIGTFSDALMAEAKKNRWTVISMKNDWKVIFPFEGK